MMNKPPMQDAQMGVAGSAAAASNGHNPVIFIDNYEEKKQDDQYTGTAMGPPPSDP